MNIRKVGPLVCSLLLLARAPAVAQTAGVATPNPGVAKPYQGLFGTRADASARTTFDVTATVAAAYDDDVYADVGSVINPTVDQPSGYFTMLLAGADYGWRGRRTTVGATASSALRYYPDLKQVQSVSHTAGFGFSALFARRTTLFANQGFAYSPSYLYSLFPALGPLAPGDGPPAAPDFASSDTQSYSYTTNVSLSHGLTRRGQLTAAFDANHTDFVYEIQTQRDLTSYGASVEFAQNVSRETALRVRYRFRTGDFGYTIGRSATEHAIDAGVDYSRSLSPTRRATFGFSVGSAAVDNTVTFAGVGEFDRQYRMLGDAHFGFQFARSWQTSGSYRRGLEYVPGLRGPVYTSGFTATVDGFFGRRWDVLASAGFSDGESALVSEASTFDTYTASVRARYALNRMWAFYSEYLYYYYDFRGSAQLPVGVPPVLERNAVRIGLMLWVPVKSK